MNKIAIFGYGSLINLESASRTLHRTLKYSDVCTAILNNYHRTWTYWSDVYSTALEKNVKGVFLNIELFADSNLNGIVFEINNEELEYLKNREKNYTCTDITDNVVFDDGSTVFDKIFTFVGNETNLLKEMDVNTFIFDKYLNIINSGLKTFGNNFQIIFENTTGKMFVPLLEGDYIFLDKEQQKAR